MDTIRITPLAGVATVDHLTGRRHAGGPVTPYRRVERREVEPNYGVRRLGALGVVAVGLLVVAQTLGATASFFGSSPALADGGGAEAAAEVEGTGTHVARAGDSLWSIADEHRGGAERDSYIDALVELNGGTSIQVGQAVLLP